MTLQRTLVPPPGADTVYVYGRTFSATITLASNDGACTVLASNGWSMLPLQGTTAQRPALAGPNNGDVYLDTSLGKIVFAQWGAPANSGRVVGWIDQNGNSV